MRIQINPKFKIFLVGLMLNLPAITQCLVQEAKSDSDEIRKKIDAELQSIAKSHHVEIYLIPADLYFRTNIDAGRLESHSCEFANLSEKKDIPAFIADLIKENVRSITNSLRTRDDFRAGIKSGNAVVYLDSLTHFGAITGKIGEYYVVLDGSFLDKFFNFINKNNFLIVSDTMINIRYGCSFNKYLYSG